MQKLKDIIINNMYVVLSWGFMLWVFWFLKYKQYGGNLDVDIMYAIIFPIVWFLKKLLSEDTEEQSEQLEQSEQCPDKVSKFGNIIIILLIAIISIFALWYLLFVNVYEIGAYLYFGILISLAICNYLEKFKNKKQLKSKKLKKEPAWFRIVLIHTIIVSTILFCVIANPITIKEGRQLVAENGFQNVQYVDSIEHIGVLKVMFPERELKLAKHEDTMNFYLYRGEKNGSIYDIAVSLIGRRIVGEAIVDNDSVLEIYFKK